MDNILQTEIKYKNKKINVLNDINLDLSLSFNNLSYTLLYSNNQNLLNNSIVFNLEDTDTLYNIFIENSEQYSYQLNNILYIDNEKNIHPLNYNLFTINNFKINNNNIELNILENNNKQTIYSYNYNSFSYIYSNINNLDKLNILNKGLYKFSTNFKLNSNDNISLNIYKYDYNNDAINNLVKNYYQAFNKYNENINLFPNTTKYKKIYYYNNLQLVPTNNELYNEFNIIYKDKDHIKNIDKNIEDIYLINNNYTSLFDINSIFYKIPIITGKYFTIDIPIIYEYESYVSNSLDYMTELYNIDINKFNISFDLSRINIPNGNYYIRLDVNKSYIYDYKPIQININSKNNIYNFNKITVLLRACLYFTVNESIYENIYKYIYSYNPELYTENVKTYKNNILNNLFILSIKYENIINYNIKLFIDCSRNMFRKLYHNYNYGFNFDKHGECIGLLLFPHKNSKYVDDHNHKSLLAKYYSNITGYHDYGSISCKRNQVNFDLYMNKKDIYINFSDYSLKNILVKSNIYTDKIFNNNIPNFNNVLAHTLHISKNNVSGKGYKGLEVEEFKIVNIGDFKKAKIIYNISNLNCSNINYLYCPHTQNRDFDDLMLINGINLSKYCFHDTYHDISAYDWVLCENEYIYSTYDSYGNYRPNHSIIGTYAAPMTTYDYNYIIYDNITFANSKDFSFGKLQITKYNNANTLNNPYFMDHNLHNKIFDNIYNYRKSGMQFGDFYTPSIQNYMMMYKFNVVNMLNERIYNNYKNSTYYLSSCQFYNNPNQDIKYHFCVNENFKMKINEVNNDYIENDYIWPMFSIPDFSIINSNDYYVVFDENENCEYIDYYINKNQKEIFINVRSYIYDQNFVINFYSDNNKLKIHNDNINYIDKENNIIKLRISIQRISSFDKSLKFTIYYKDIEDYLNNYKINNKNYRILCKVCLKINDI